MHIICIYLFIAMQERKELQLFEDQKEQEKEEQQHLRPEHPVEVSFTSLSLSPPLLPPSLPPFMPLTYSLSCPLCRMSNENLLMDPGTRTVDRADLRKSEVSMGIQIIFENLISFVMGI